MDGVSNASSLDCVILGFYCIFASFADKEIVVSYVSDCGLVDLEPRMQSNADLSRQKCIRHLTQLVVRLCLSFRFSLSSRDRRE